MSAMVIYENDQVTVWYYPDKKIIHHQMHKYTHGQVFRDALTAGMEVMEKYGVKKWLSDDRMNPVINRQDRVWANGTWHPRAIKAGWKYWAIVEPKNQVNQMNMEKIAKLNKKMGLIVQAFYDPDEAMKWLESLP